MDRPLRWVSGAAARSRMAHAWLGSDVAATLGSITLHPHQRDAVARARAALDDHGGVLIADDVGLGKTFVALAVAAGARRPLVIAPASLRAMWARACEQANVRAQFRSYEATSRAPMRNGEHDLVILDEAHHARTICTARYRHLSRGLVGARVLLLSATPVHNSVRDLRALLALFLGSMAWSIDEDELATHVIRRERDDVPTDALPTLEPRQWLALSHDHDLLDAITSLPSPVPLRNGGDGGALVSFTLARLWASSHAALRSALIRRLQRARALEDALSCGRYPTAAELRAWTIGEDAAQLAFPELATTSLSDDNGELIRALRAHADAIDVLIRRVPVESMCDRERAARISEIVARHAGEKVVAFTQFADTAAMLFRYLSRTVRCCQLDGRGARVAGGRLSRREALARFAPRATGALDPPAAERIDLLLTTDLLSEGVNLQDASVVVHLDLPWTSARIAQRVGRSRRVGAVHAATSVYAFAPPASAETLLRQEQRLRDKLRAAARVTGACGAILPVRFSLAIEPTEPDIPSPPRVMHLLRRVVSRWSNDQPPDSPHAEEGIAVGHVRSEEEGALALVRHDARYMLAAWIGGRVSDAPAHLLAAGRLAEGADRDAPNESLLSRAMAKLNSWLLANAGASTAGIGHTIAGAARRAAMKRIAHIAARTPRHHRAAVSPLAAEARRIVTAPYGAGAERILAELADAPLPDEAWLRAVRAFGEANCRGAEGAGGAGGAEGDGVIEAIIVFGP